VGRRGYFVEGLGGAQFALPGAVERLRAAGGGEAPPLVLAAVDPAQPYGAALAWPARADSRRPARVPGAYVVLTEGEPILYLERGGRALQTLVPCDDPRVEPALMALIEQVRAGRMRRIALEKVDGESALVSSLGTALVALGFQQGPRRLILSA
jgi:ATP-dependent helicase Lhr and Lhr-like helicase